MSRPPVPCPHGVARTSDCADCRRANTRRRVRAAYQRRWGAIGRLIRREPRRPTR